MTRMIITTSNINPRPTGTAMAIGNTELDEDDELALAPITGCCVAIKVTVHVNPSRDVKLSLENESDPLPCTLISDGTTFPVRVATGVLLAAW